MPQHLSKKHFHLKKQENSVKEAQQEIDPLQEETRMLDEADAVLLAQASVLDPFTPKVLINISEEQRVVIRNAVMPSRRRVLNTD
jgi:aspartokinase-like uncharacterized kinase